MSIVRTTLVVFYSHIKICTLMLLNEKKSFFKYIDVSRNKFFFLNIRNTCPRIIHQLGFICQRMIKKNRITF